MKNDFYKDPDPDEDDEIEEEEDDDDWDDEVTYGNGGISIIISDDPPEPE